MLLNAARETCRVAFRPYHLSIRLLKLVCEFLKHVVGNGAWSVWVGLYAGGAVVDHAGQLLLFFLEVGCAMSVCVIRRGLEVLSNVSIHFFGALLAVEVPLNFFLNLCVHVFRHFEELLTGGLKIVVHARGRRHRSLPLSLPLSESGVRVARSLPQEMGAKRVRASAGGEVDANMNHRENKAKRKIKWTSL